MLKNLQDIADKESNPILRRHVLFYIFLVRYLGWIGKIWSTIQSKLPSFLRSSTALQSTPPSVRRQWIWALLLLCSQTGITFTGALVRVTGSGLGCSTWPQCQPGSFVPVEGSAPLVHQLIEFGNRLLTFILIIFALGTFILLLKAARRSGILTLSFYQGIGIILQAVIGGITVHMNLAWWTVALHFLPSMLLVFFAAVLLIKISEPDDGTKTAYMPRPLALLTTLSAVLLAVTLMSGTLVTASGPHAGDKEILPEHRLQIPLVEIANLHAHAMYLYLGVTIGLLAGLLTYKVHPQLKKSTYWLLAAIIIQGVIGIAQYWLGVPRWTVPIHVIGSGIVTAATGLVWAQRYRFIS